MSLPKVVSEEVVQQWPSRDGHTTSLVKVTEDHDGSMVWGYGLKCSLCGWIGGGSEGERDMVARDAEYHIDWNNGE